MVGKPIGLALCCLLGFGAPAARAQMIPVEPVLAGKAFASDKTKTLLWESRNSVATLVYIPGGEGQIGLREGRSDIGGFYGTTLKPLSNPALTSGRLNVVLFDSPSMLPSGSVYPSSRATSDHLMRIESVVLHYKEKLGKPIWLMGHSNGAVSITEFYKRLQKSKTEQLVAGMVYSSARNGADFNSATTNLPVLFLAHYNDGCAGAMPGESKAVYERLKKVDTAPVEYVLIRGGSSEGDPCRSGYHMFFGAGPEAYKAIDSFIGGFYK